MNICVFTDDYPSKGRAVYTFVKQIVDEFARKGHRCCVISPFPFIHQRGFCKPYDKYAVEGDNEIIVIRPNYFTLSKAKVGKVEVSSFFSTRH